MASSTLLDRVAELREVLATLIRARLLAALRPDKYVRMVAAVRREGTSTTIGIATSARRCPNRPALVDEIGTLTYRQLDGRCDALATALQGLGGGTPETWRGVDNRDSSALMICANSPTKTGG
ncbi:hypothetical protein [Mycobacterium sp. AZCC_0083]|uniref:hypothetical protein n=1 Tax=Mycobacterium sp. AZCC_0083 TaxID=2735882 RepID=UPI00160DC6DA|nr:non-ribosomal peptide synthetase component F [Mycobacterium sp. AZCC_0083]